MTAQLQQQKSADALLESFAERHHEHSSESKSIKVYRSMASTVFLAVIALLVLVERSQAALPSEATQRRTLNSPFDPSGQDLAFTIRYGFFDGTDVRDPTQEEISGLKIVTARFFRDILKEAYPDIPSFTVERAKIVKVGPKLRKKYDVALLFKATIPFSSSPTLDQIYDVMIAADYVSYITDYVWNAQPKKKSLFYDTQSVYYTKAEPTEFGPTQSPTQEGTLPPITVCDGLDLPNITRAALLNPSSPQFKACRWLMGYPDVSSLPKWQQTQSFATMTYFFALNGEQWTQFDQERWLSYDVSDCDKLGQTPGWGFVCGYEGPFYDFGSTCNEDGRITALHGNGILSMRGSLPPEVALLSSLEVIVTIDSGFEGSLSDILVPSLGELDSLKRIYLEHTQFSSTIPLSAVGLSGTIPSALGLLTSLEQLMVTGNAITGSIPTEIGALTNLEELWMSENQIKGKLPSEMGALSNMTRLELNFNEISGKLPREIGLLSNLIYLRLANNSISGELPSEIALMTALQRLDLWENKLEGEIPPEIALLTNFQRVDMSDNRFTKIPSNFGHDMSLNLLDLSNNAISGTISSSIGAMTMFPEEHWGLPKLDLSRNKLSGSIPTELFQLVNPAKINLSFNMLTGSLPSQLGLLTTPSYYGPHMMAPKTGQLDFSHNQLTGTLPTEVGLLVNLTSLDLSFNMLSGEIPIELVELLDEREYVIWDFGETFPGGSINLVGNRFTDFPLELCPWVCSGSLSIDCGSGLDCEVCGC